MGRKVIDAPEAVAVARLIKAGVKDSVRLLGSNSTTYLFRFSASTAAAAAQLRAKLLACCPRLELPDFSAHDCSIFVSPTAEGLGWKPSDGLHCGYVVATLRRGRRSVEQTREALAAAFHSVGVELTSYALDRSLAARAVYTNPQAQRHSGGLMSKLHWVGYFIEHGAHRARARLVYSFILKRLSVRATAAAQAYLESNPAASWEEAAAAGEAAQERHREAVRQERAARLAAAGSSHAAAADEEQSDDDEEDEGDEEPEEDDAAEQGEAEQQGAAAGEAAPSGTSRVTWSTPFDWQQHKPEMEAWLGPDALDAPLDENFFKRTGWGPKQSAELGGVVTDGSLQRDLRGYSFTAHSGDIGFVAVVAALPNGFAAGSSKAHTYCDSHIHRPKAGDRLVAHYFDINWQVNSWQMATDLQQYMPAGARVSAFSAKHEQAIKRVLEETNTHAAYAAIAAGCDGHFSNSFTQKRTDDDILQIRDEGSKEPPPVPDHSPRFGFTSGNRQESNIFPHCARELLKLGRHPSADGGPKQPTTAYTGTGGVKFQLQWTGSFALYSFLKGCAFADPAHTSGSLMGMHCFPRS